MLGFVGSFPPSLLIVPLGFRRLELISSISASAVFVSTIVRVVIPCRLLLLPSLLEQQRRLKPSQAVSLLHINTQTWVVSSQPYHVVRQGD